MRNEVCQSLVSMSADPAFVFLTGDLGFQALEPLQQALGDRFINAGIAEQNMVGTAAGLAREGLNPWVYSIAPFVYARPYEQIRNDVCLHDLPVKLLGNGGGYGYGVMGSTHHAIEDYGALLCFKNIRVYVPAFGEDVAECIASMNASTHPSYLRLGRSEMPANWQLPRYAPWRQLIAGNGPTVVAVGPVAGTYLEAFSSMDDAERPNFWVVTELPIDQKSIPTRFRCQLQASQRLMVIEEHVQQGGAGQMLAHSLMSMGEKVENFVHCFAAGYPSGRYGSQPFHREESGLDVESIMKDLSTLSKS